MHIEESGAESVVKSSEEKVKVKVWVKKGVKREKYFFLKKFKNQKKVKKGKKGQNS